MADKDFLRKLWMQTEVIMRLMETQAKELCDLRKALVGQLEIEEQLEEAEVKKLVQETSLPGTSAAKSQPASQPKLELVIYLGIYHQEVNQFFEALEAIESEARTSYDLDFLRQALLTGRFIGWALADSAGKVYGVAVTTTAHHEYGNGGTLAGRSVLHVALLSIAPGFRRRGLGSALLNQIMGSHPVQNFWTSVPVPAEAYEMMGFLKKHDFTKEAADHSSQVFFQTQETAIYSFLRKPSPLAHVSGTQKTRPEFEKPLNFELFLNASMKKNL